MTIFNITSRSTISNARTGKLIVNNIELETPLFLPVATIGTVKSLSFEDLKLIGFPAIIVNVLHLSERPGTEIIENHGGLKNFINWNGIVFGDSGGFQLIRNFDMKVIDEGIVYKSPFNGTTRLITPEYISEINESMKIDVRMILDYCPKKYDDYETVKNAVYITSNWAKRFINFARNTRHEALNFAICQGGIFTDLRKQSISDLNQLDFDGFGVGGLSIGEPHDKMFDALRVSCLELPVEKPRYFMGLGSTDDIIESVRLGVDIFDSTYPTRCARHGTVLTKNGSYNLGNRDLLNKKEPLEENCSCFTCKNYSKGYVNHLFREKELTSMRLITIHNLSYMHGFFEEIRERIRVGTL